MTDVAGHETHTEGKAAHPIELFFDLVYVFGFTRVVGLIVHDHNLTSALQGALILGLLWWSWGVWTWTMNAVDLTSRLRRVAILLAMIGIFLMGYAVPNAFDGDGIWLGIGYFISRFFAALVGWFGSPDDEVEQASVRNFIPISFIAPVVVIVGGLVGGDALEWIWLVALLIEVGTALLAGQNEWHVDAEHFAERHGLIMIIALGEAIIAVGIALTAAAGEGAEISVALAWRLGVGLAAVGVFWWAYFDKLQVIWETRLHEADAMETGKIGRDLYSLSHYPMITGVVFFAVALEEAFLHPADPLTGFTRWMLATSISLYLIAQAVAIYRAYRQIMRERIIGVVLIWIVSFTLDLKADLMIVLVTLILVITITAEYFRYREEVLSNPHLRR